MSEYTHPSIEILLAVYRPNLGYLRTQLLSLSAQTYPRLSVTLLDDSADEDMHRAIAEEVRFALTSRPYRLLRNNINLGVSGTFSQLTKIAQGDLLAYCDQDDAWLPEKLARLTALLDDGESKLAYCNQSIIDEAGRERYPTLQALNPRYAHQSGAKLFPYFLTDNCISGCTMLVRRELAQSALPFPTAYVHDQWLALCASAEGPIAYDPTPLIQYRLHGGNVIGMGSLSGVTDRLSYVSARLEPEQRMLEAAEQRFLAAEQQDEIRRQACALSERIAYVSHRNLTRLPGLIRALWRDPSRLGFEALLGISPRFLEKRLVAFAKKH